MAHSLDLSPRTKDLLEKIQAITHIGDGDQDNGSSSNKEPLLHLYVHLLEVISVLQEIDDAVKGSNHELIKTLSDNKYNNNSNKAISKKEINDLSSAVLPGLVGAIGRGFTGLLLNGINDNDEETHTTVGDEDSNIDTDVLNQLDTLVNRDRNQALANIFREEVAKRFPNILSKKHKITGQTLLHYVAEKAKSGTSGRHSLDLLLEYMPKDAEVGADSRDNFGALPLHWATRNGNMSMDFLHGILSACSEAPMTKDDRGYLPIHWAVSVDKPDMYTIGLLLSIHPGGAATPCSNGNLPLHIAVNRQNPSAEVVSALLHIFPEAAKMHCKKGWLPIHRCVNRPNPSPQVLKILLDIYSKGLQFSNVHMSLPIHCMSVHPDPSVPIIQKLIDMNPSSLSIADEHGYLPLHCIIDNYDPNAKLAISILQQFPEAAATKTKEGFLPLHLMLSSNKNPNLELVDLLLEEYPDAINYAVEDKVPDTDVKVNIDEYQGPWKSHTWTPLVMAIERNLIGVISKIKNRMKSMKVTAIDVKSIDQSLSLKTDIDTGRSSAYYSQAGSRKSNSKKLGSTSSNKGWGNKVAVDIGDDSDTSELGGFGGFGENLRGSLDSLEGDVSRIVKTTVTAEPLSKLRPLSRQLEKSGMLMDNVDGGISIVNTTVPKRRKLPPLRPIISPLSGKEIKSSVKTNGFDFNDFDSSLGAADSIAEGSIYTKTKNTNFDDESISSKGSNT